MKLRLHIRRILCEHGFLVWPGVFLLRQVLAFQGVPVSWNWDNFSYLDAAKTGVLYVPLGFGRTTFCALGWFMERAARIVELDHLWGGFHLWFAVTTVITALALSWGGLALASKYGPGAAHCALALFTFDVNTSMLYQAVWPENWSFIFLVCSIGFLMEGRMGFAVRLGLSLLAAILMVLMKEVAIYYIPALMLLVWILSPSLRGRWLRPAASLAWGLAAAGGPFLVGWCLGFFVPGLAEARGEIFAHHFGQGHVGLASAEANLITLSKGWLASWGVLLALAIMVGRLLRSRRVRQNFDQCYALLGFGLSLVVFPALLIVLASAEYAVPRYSAALIPGLGLLVAASVARCGEASNGQGGWMRAAAALVLCLAIIWSSDHETWRYYQKAAREDRARYAAMKSLLDTDLGVVAAGDAWPAHFIYLHAAPTTPKGKWTIYWPDWDMRTGGHPGRDWVAKQLADERRIAVSPTAAERAGVALPELLSSIAPMNFQPHPSGWWIGPPIEERPDSPDSNSRARSATKGSGEGGDRQ